VHPERFVYLMVNSEHAKTGSTHSLRSAKRCELNKVNIFEISRNTKFQSSRDPRANQYRVKWRVQGRDKTRSFRTKTQAEHFRRRLFTALESGDHFDSTTGLPLSWTQVNKTFAEVASEFTKQLWPSLAASSKRSSVEALSYSILYLTRSRKNFPFDLSIMTRAAKHQVLHPQPPVNTSTELIQARDWLLNNSLRISEIDGEVINGVLARLNKDLQGTKTVSPATFRRRRQALNATFIFATKKQYLKRNPMEFALFKKPQIESSVDPSIFLTVEECRDHVSLLDANGEDSKRIGTFVSILWLAGLRPGEALGLKKSDLKFEKHNPRIEVRRNVVQVGKAWTDSGLAQETKAPKSRSIGHVRSVPIPKELENRLKRYTKKLSDQDYLFANSRSEGSLSLTVFEDAWIRIRKKPTRLYDLRHTNASILIYSGLNVIEVAARLGHSVNVCARTYLHVFDSYSASSNEKIETFLRPKRPKVRRSKTL
jgi:integrase